ncbi:MAG: adenylate/guanylate cyclase domain-containing protein [Gemmatimonadetes bacterium]|nr:adenylate/guanylate cyclase domain-containing protein [Gemmatimonadota bacterium]
MDSSRIDRRLAAIVAADVVGYSRLIERDETGTLERLKALRKLLIEPIISGHHGHIVKLMGDGALVEFPSASAAVEAAVRIQRAVEENQRGQPGEDRLSFRIGVNLGDVVHEDGDIFGDGVILAARLEKLAEPGGICVARNVYEQARNRLPLAFASMGRHRLKNITEPVHVWRVCLEAPASGRRIGTARLSGRVLAAAGLLTLALVAAFGVWWLDSGGMTRPAEMAQSSSHPSLVVLPLENMSGDTSLDYFSDGLTEDLTTHLAAFPELSVVARSAAFTYKGKAVDMKQVGRELGARYAIEGSVRRDGERVRITAQLIDTASGFHVWGERFDEEGTDVFALQDQVVEKVAAAIAGEHGRIRAAGYRQAWEMPDAELAEYDYFLRVHSLIYRFTRKDMEEAGRVAREGLGHFPDSALIRIKLGWVHLQFVRFGWSDDPQHDLAEAYRLGEAAMRSTKLPALARLHGHWLMAMVLGRYRQDLEQMEAEADRAMQMAPRDSEVRAVLSEPYAFLGLPEKALALLQRALKEDAAMNAMAWPQSFLAVACFGARKYEAAIEAANRAGGEATLFAAASHAALGQLHEARAAASAVLARDPALTLADVRQRYPFRNPADLDRLLGNLQKAGLPDRT